MDAYEATKLVFSRIQALDPDNAAKIMGLLLIQEHGEKDMIRLAFGPDSLLHSLVLNARVDLGLFSPPPLLSRQNTPPSRLAAAAASSWAPPQPLSRSNSILNNDLVDDFIPFMGWGVTGNQRVACSTAADLDPAGFGWRPCVYFDRGYCKNGSTCRFIHDPSTGEIDPYSPTGSVPASSPSSKCMSFLLQQQQNDTQRAAAALMLAGEETNKFLGRRMERSDFAGMVNPCSRQIYLTFPADSTFREEDVSNYFSIYGPVQDVRIPYQQKRMFGFVTFVYPETVKLILAKGNPHFVCDSRVLVKPYKEKGKVPDKYRKLQLQTESGDFFSGCSSPTSPDPRDPYDLGMVTGSRMIYGSCRSQELLLRMKIEEEQQAAELQQAIELQGRRFMGLQLLNLKNRRGLSSPIPSVTQANPISRPGGQDDKNLSSVPAAATAISCAAAVPVNAADNGVAACGVNPEVDINCPESGDHNLPDSPFDSPILAACEAATANSAPLSNTAGVVTPNSTLDMASFKSCFFQIPRFSPGHGAVGM